MKKAGWLFVLGLSFFLLSGCANESSSGGGGSSGGSVHPSDAPLIESSIKRAEEAANILWGGKLEVDYDDMYETETEEGEILRYYRVTDEKYQSLADLEHFLREVFSDRIYYGGYEGYIYRSGGPFVEENGKLYFAKEQDEEETPFETFVWDIDSYRLGYKIDDRKVFYLDLEKSSAEKSGFFGGKVAFVLQGDEWKLDTDIPFSTGEPYHIGSRFSSREELLQFAGRTKHGWRMEKPIEKYITEVDESLWLYRSPSGDDDYYYGLNVYSADEEKLHLQDKIFIPFDIRQDEVLLPERDEQGIFHLDYSAAITEPGDGLFAYLSMQSESEEKEREKREQFQADQRSYPRGFGRAGDGSFWIVPKYYGTRIAVFEKDPSGRVIQEFFSDQILMIEKDAPIERIELQYKDRIVVIDPSASEHEQGEKITFDFSKRAK